MFKNISFPNPILNKKIAFIFSFLFFINSFYYAYHAIFTPFVSQIINCRFVYIILIFIFFILYFLGKTENEITWEKITKTVILILLPSAILILIGYLNYPESFKKNARLFANLIIISSTFIFFLKTLGYKKISELLLEFKIKKTLAIDKKSKKNNFLIGSALFVLIVVNLGFGTYYLAKFAAIDEPLWTFERIPKFWNNTLDGEWHKTMISDKPGITVALLSGIGLIQTNPKEYELAKQEEEIRYSTKNIETMNFPMRFPILLFNALSLLVIFYLLSKLLNKQDALLAVIFIGLSPILLGISRIINPDSVFWVFSTLTFLTYLLFLKNQEKKYLFITAIFLGLSLLTKYIANFFYVFFFAMIFINFVLNEKEELIWAKYFKKSISNYLIIIYLSILTFFILLPATWVDLGRIAEVTIFSEAFLKFWQMFLVVVFLVLGEIYFLKGKVSGIALNYFFKKRNVLIKIISALFLLAIIFSVLNVLLGMKWSDFETILASPKSFIINPENVAGAFLANFYPLIFGIHPIALLLLLVSFVSILFRKQRKEIDLWTVYIALFTFFFYVACFFNNIGATVRYQIIIYPLAFIVSSMGLNILLKNFGEKIKLISIGVIVIFLLLSLNNIRPFYFSYASEFLPKNYVLNLKDMGDGSYEAAEYLNSKPNAKDLIIWTDKRGVCYFFQGGCMDTFELYSGTKIDYFVVSASRQSRTERRIPYKGRHNDFEIQVETLYKKDNYEYILNIGDRPNNFVKIFSYAEIISGN